MPFSDIPVFRTSSNGGQWTVFHYVVPGYGSRGWGIGSLLSTSGAGFYYGLNRMIDGVYPFLFSPANASSPFARGSSAAGQLLFQMLLTVGKSGWVGSPRFPRDGQPSQEQRALSRSPGGTWSWGMIQSFLVIVVPRLLPGRMFPF